MVGRSQKISARGSKIIRNAPELLHPFLYLLSLLSSKDNSIIFINSKLQIQGIQSQAEISGSSFYFYPNAELNQIILPATLFVGYSLKSEFLFIKIMLNLSDSPNKQLYEPLPSGDQLCCSKKCSDCVIKNFSIFNIIFYQFTATTFFTYLVFIYGGTTTAPGVIVTVFGMFMCFMWVARFTGTFMNPAIVIACMIKKERTIPLLKGIILIIVQIFASFAGAFLAWVVSGHLPQPIQDNTDLNDTATIFLREIIGTFLYILVVLILISSDTTFVQMEIQVWFTMPLILIAVCELVQLPLGTNPSWGLAYNVVYGIYVQNFSLMENTWSIIVGPLIGALLSGFFFEFLFRRFILAYKTEIKREQELFLSRLNEAEKAEREFKSRMTILQLV